MREDWTSEVKRIIPGTPCESPSCLRNMGWHPMGICASCGGPTTRVFHHNCDKCWDGFVTMRGMREVLGDERD